MIRTRKVHDIAPSFASMSSNFATITSKLKKNLALDKGETDKVMQDTSWADGLRGLASIFVVSSHLVLCFARKIVLPCCGHNGSESPLLFQLPPFRLLGMGHSWVAVFFILLGFVNALKPLRLARARQAQTALGSLAVASFRRTFRLMLPAAAATVISWFICQLGMYETARNGDAYWMYTYTPMMSESWGSSIQDLLEALRDTWMLQGVNPYDQPQWALVFLLQGSLMVFMALLITVNLTPFWRVATLFVFSFWSMDLSFELRDPLVGVTVFGGIMLAELSLSDWPARLVPYTSVLSSPLIILGLLFMSVPSDFTQTAWWSDFLTTWGKQHFPAVAQIELHRTWGSLGAITLIAGIILSPHARHLLSAKPLAWLGRVSFPIYLLHGMFVRSVLAWLMFGAEPQSFNTDQGTVIRYPQGSDVRIFFSVIISMSMMLVASHYWTLKLEPIFGQITAVAESVMFGKASHAEDAKLGKPILPVRKE